MIKLNINTILLTQSISINSINIHINNIVYISKNFNKDFIKILKESKYNVFYYPSPINCLHVYELLKQFCLNIPLYPSSLCFYTIR